MTRSSRRLRLNNAAALEPDAISFVSRHDASAVAYQLDAIDRTMAVDKDVLADL